MAKRSERRREFWRGVVERYDARPERMTLTAFCFRERVNSASLFRWRRRFQNESDASGALVRVHVAEPTPPAGDMQIVTPDGFTICLSSEGQLADAMRILRDASC